MAASRHITDSLYIASMDHCPSEQIYGDDNLWHTTVIVVSPGVEHAALANRIAAVLRPKNPVLMKWVNGTKKYQANFLRTFVESLRQFPQVYVFAVSATESKIIGSADHFVDQLGLSDRYDAIFGSNVSLGPFFRNSSSKPAYVSLSPKRAVMCMFIMHFVRRMHGAMYEAINFTDQTRPSAVNWNFFHDKFPGPPDDNMALMFQVLCGVDQSRGRILPGYFAEGGTQEIDNLADNLAGALDRGVQASAPLCSNSFPIGQSGFFYWEQWS